MNLEQRVAALEALTSDLAGQARASKKSARRWRLTAMAAGLAMVGGLGMAAGNARTRANTITAEHIEVVNGDDDVMIDMSSDDYGGLIVVNNANGDRAGSIEVWGDADEGTFRGLFTACDEDGTARASMQVDEYGGMFRVQATSNEDINGTLDIFNDTARVYVTNSDGRDKTFMP